jgi:TatD DNase family protein
VAEPGATGPTKAIVGLFDTHCHLDMLKDTPDEALVEARAAGVDAVVAVGIDLRSSRIAADLAATHDEVYAAVGVHPHDAVGFDAVVRTGLERLLTQRHVVAVGECGLDFYRDLAPRDVQREAFAEQLELARSADKPVCVHSREAGGETFALLTEHGGGLRIVLHCFSTPEYVELANERGYYVSFAGNLTYKDSSGLRKAALEVREDLLLVETDAPFLTPMPRRGHPNRPANVGLTAQFLARLRGWSDDEVAAITSANARRAFGLSAPAASAGPAGPAGPADSLAGPVFPA